MKVVTGELMKEIDKCAIEDFNVPSIILMENASLSVVNIILENINTIKNPKITVVCGKGNNGGDGFCIARHLYQKNIDVNVIIVGDSLITEDALTNLNIIKKLQLPIIELKNEKEFDIVKELILKADIVVDAILGTGLKGGTKGIIKQTIDIINDNSRFTISVDIPSGVNSQTGHVETNAIQADITITFELVKQGLILYPGAEYTSELIVTNIGIPKQIINNIDTKVNVLEDKDIINLIPKRSARTNKGSYGKLMVIGGCEEMTGAVILTCKSAYKTGVGLVNLVAPKEVINITKCQTIENVNTIVPSFEGKVCLESFEKIKDSINKYDAIAIGPGLGQSKQVTEFIYEFLYNVTIPIVLDADALNAISKDINILKLIKAPVIITPHPGEMSRLINVSIEDILNNTLYIVKEFSSKYNVITLLKDARTIIGNNKGEIYINTTGNASMAKAGSGDVLTGIIGSLLAQGKDPFLAAAISAYIHGRAGEKASKHLGMYGVLASDICNYITI